LAILLLIFSAWMAIPFGVHFVDLARRQEFTLNIASNNIVVTKPKMIQPSLPNASVSSQPFSIEFQTRNISQE
jgi:hypothetical protein